MIRTSGIYIKLTEYFFRIKKPDVDYWIAKTLIEKIDDFPNIYIDEIAYLAKTTSSSVTKFCKKLGYDSFKSMRTDIETLNIYGQGEKNLYGEFDSSLKFSGHLTEEELISSFLDKEKLTDEKIFELFDKNQIKNIVEKIKNQKELVILGSLYSSSSVNFFRELLSIEGYTVFEIDRQADTRIIQNLLLEKDSTFIISLSGEWVRQNESWLKEDCFKSRYLITVNNVLDYSNVFDEVINLSNMGELFQSNYYTERIINLWFISLVINLKVNK